MPEQLVSGESSFPDLQMATFSLHCHMGERESELNDVFFYKGIILIMKALSSWLI